MITGIKIRRADGTWTSGGGVIAVNSDPTRPVKPDGPTVWIDPAYAFRHPAIVAVQSILVSDHYGDRLGVVKPSGGFNKLAATPSGHAIAVNAAGATVLSTDYGATWATGGSPFGFSASGLAMDDVGHVIAGGISTLALSTSGDYGATWTTRSSPLTVNSTAVAFETAGHAVIVGGGGQTGTSADYGASWTARAGASSALYSVAVLPDGHAIAVGASGTVLMSTNYGVTWSSRASGTSAALRAVAMIPDGHAIIAGDSAILTSTDYGATWTARSGAPAASSSVSLIADGHAAIIGSGSVYVCLLSADYGTTWTSTAVPSAGDVKLIDTTLPIPVSTYTGHWTDWDGS